MITVVRLHVRILLAFASIVLIACTSPTVSNRSPDGQIVTITTFNGGYQGIIAAQPTEDSNETIKIFVGGLVKTPGVYEVPAGTTILQAIERAGGFRPLADAKDLRVLSQSGKHFRPGLYRLNRFGKPPLVWFGNADRAQDFVLEDGMTIEVPIYL